MMIKERILFPGFLSIFFFFEFWKWLLTCKTFSKSINFGSYLLIYVFVHLLENKLLFYFPVNRASWIIWKLYKIDWKNRLEENWSWSFKKEKMMEKEILELKVQSNRII